MTLTEFVKKLITFDVFWGRRSKIFHGVRDGGAKAASIGNNLIAKAHDGNTIFNVNHPQNECQGGHYHDPFLHNEKVCLDFAISDWVNNQIEIIATGIPGPGQIGPHTYDAANCFQVQVYKKIAVNIGKEVFTSIVINGNTKSIYLRKTSLPPAFNGKVIIDAE